MKSPADAEPAAPKKPSRSVGERIISAGIAVLAAHICVKLAGVLQNNIIPNKYGLAVSDVFTVVYDTVLGTAFSIGEQCLAPAYLPVFTRAMEKDGEARAWRYTSILFNLQFVILLVVTGALMLYPDYVVRGFTEWNSGDAAMLMRRDMARSMLPYIAPGLLGMSLASLTYVVLNGYKKFFIAAFGDAMLKFSILGGALVGAAAGKGDWRFIAAGAVCGGTLKLVTHVAALRWERLRQYVFSFNLNDEYVKAFIMLVLPLLAGIFVSKGRDAVFTKVLTSKEGLPTFYKLGRIVVDSIGFLVPYTLSIAMLPYFCDLSARDDRSQLGEVLTKILRMLVWFFVPVSIVVAVSALPVSAAFYAGKTMSTGELKNVALVVQLFSMQLPFAAIEMMVMQAFFSSQRMIAPTVAGFVFSIVSAGAAYFLVKGNYVDSPVAILLTVSISFVLTKILKSLLLIGLLRSTVPVLPLSETAAYLTQLLIAAAAAAAAAWGAAMLYKGPLSGLSRLVHSERAANIAETLCIGMAGAGAYLLVSLLLRMREPHQCYEWTLQKVKMRGAKSRIA